MPSTEKPGIYTLKAVFDSGPLVGKVAFTKKINILSAQQAALAGSQTMQQGPLVGKAAPELQSATWLQGQPITLSKLRDKVVLLDFWATWCVPCIAEFPTLQKFYKETRNQGIEVISLAVANDPQAPLKRLITKHRITFPVMVDTDGGNALGATFDAYRVRALPRQVVIDQHGIVRYHGQSMEEALRIARQLQKGSGAGAKLQTIKND